jgi:ATP-dependent RNA helicase MSS116
LFIVPQENHVTALMNLLGRETQDGDYKIIVFFTTARLTGFMAELFNSVSNKLNYKVLEIHSRKSQAARQKASDQFRKAKNAILFSSDVSARGMDYPDVTFVLQVGLTERDQYIHRLGRTARAGKEGKGALLLAPYEENHMVQKELKDMPLQKTTSVPVTTGIDTIATRALQNVEEQKALKISAEQSYRAWLGYYNSALKKVGWDKKQLVLQANSWAKESGLKDQPGLEKKTIGKMGLKGVPGLKIQ